jgi:uncharacterized membrane protein (TIGR02234 family)
MLLALAAAALYASTKLTWSFSLRQTDFRGVVADKLDGAQRETALVPLAFVQLAAVAAAVATRGVIRRIVGVVVSLFGLLTIWVALKDIGEAFGSHVAGYPTAQVLAGHGLATLGGLLGLFAGVLLTIHASRYAGMGGQYSSSKQQRTTVDKQAKLWQELSSGQDPTVKPPDVAS